MTACRRPDDKRQRVVTDEHEREDRVLRRILGDRAQEERVPAIRLVVARHDDHTRAHLLSNLRVDMDSRVCDADRAGLAMATASYVGNTYNEVRPSVE